MDVYTRALAADLRRYPSEEGARRLMTQYPVGSPDWGVALILMQHASFKKRDRLALAEHYLSRMPYATGSIYILFAKMLSTKDMIKIVLKYLPTDAGQLDFLFYYLGPALREQARSPEDHQQIDALLTRKRTPHP